MKGWGWVGIVVLLVGLVAGVGLSAQSPFPCGVQMPDGGWVPCDHPLARATWGVVLVPGHRYEGVYGFEMVTLGALRSVVSGKWLIVGEITKSGGSPPVGQVLTFRVDEKVTGWIDRGPAQ